MGLITATRPSSDGKVRKVEIKTASQGKMKTFYRPVKGWSGVKWRLLNFGIKSQAGSVLPMFIYMHTGNRYEKKCGVACESVRICSLRRAPECNDWSTDVLYVWVSFMLCVKSAKVIFKNYFRGCDATLAVANNVLFFLCLSLFQFHTEWIIIFQ